MAPVIIIGLARCGTTDLQRRLVKAGYATDDWLVQGDEPTDLVGWNESEYNYNPPYLSPPFPYDPNPYFKDRLRAYRDRVEHGLGSVPYVIKEPRIYMFLKVYAAVWPDAHYILCERSQQSVYLSQAKRRKMQGTYDTCAFQFHMRSAMAIANLLNADVAFFRLDYTLDRASSQVKLREFLGNDEVDLVSGFNFRHQSYERDDECADLPATAGEPAAEVVASKHDPLVQRSAAIQAQQKLDDMSVEQLNRVLIGLGEEQKALREHVDVITQMRDKRAISLQSDVPADVPRREADAPG